MNTRLKQALMSLLYASAALMALGAAAPTGPGTEPEQLTAGSPIARPEERQWIQHRPAIHRLSGRGMSCCSTDTGSCPGRSDGSTNRMRRSARRSSSGRRRWRRSPSPVSGTSRSSPPSRQRVHVRPPSVGGRRPDVGRLAGGLVRAGAACHRRPHRDAGRARDDPEAPDRRADAQAIALRPPRPGDRGRRAPPDPSEGTPVQLRVRLSMLRTAAATRDRLSRCVRPPPVDHGARPSRAGADGGAVGVGVAVPRPRAQAPRDGRRSPSSR